MMTLLRRQVCDPFLIKAKRHSAVAAQHLGGSRINRLKQAKPGSSSSELAFAVSLECWRGELKRGPGDRIAGADRNGVRMSAAP
jgi:hypothetical protein